MVTYACAFSQSELGKYFELIINKVIELYCIVLYKSLNSIKWLDIAK